MRAFLFSRAGILRRSHDHKLRGHNRGSRDDFSAVALAPGFHYAFNQFQDSALDAFSDRTVPTIDPPRVYLLPGTRLLDQAQTAGCHLVGKVLPTSYHPNAE